MFTRNVLSAVIIAVLLFSTQGYAITPERGLNNPLFLTEMDEAALVYGAYDPESKEFLISYSEYDEYAKGYGAFVLQTGGEDSEGAFSFIGVKELGNTGLGLAVHRLMGSTSDWLLDLGTSHRIGNFSGRMGVHGLPFTRWSEIKEHRDVSAGVSMYLLDSYVLGVDVWLLDEREYHAHLLAAITPDLTARLNLVYQSPSWNSAGADIWYTRNNVLFHLGYTIIHDSGGRFRFGLGVKF